MLHFISRQREENEERKIPKASGFGDLVDVNGLEPLTLRTSSECSTS